VTAEQIAELVAAGRFWWLRDGQFIATDSHTPQTGSDVYLLDASPQWVAQWGRDWQALADYLTPMLARLEEL
jgi:hypothetical protein